MLRGVFSADMSLDMHMLTWGITRLCIASTDWGVAGGLNVIKD